LGDAKREIAFSQLQITVMNQPSQPNQRLKLTQEEGIVGKCDTLEMNYGKEGADDGVGLLLHVARQSIFLY
jgi:hypothetical protein